MSNNHGMLQGGVLYPVLFSSTFKLAVFEASAEFGTFCGIPRTS